MLFRASTADNQGADISTHCRKARRADASPLGVPEYPVGRDVMLAKSG
jgi:hypothetical protein